jgi:hypothetical protein
MLQEQTCVFAFIYTQMISRCEISDTQKDSSTLSDTFMDTAVKPRYDEHKWA